MKQRTMAGLDKIKDKIKKLFALSKSPNANEAAAALEMAQKLMAEYGIIVSIDGEFEIMREEVKGNSGQKPPTYEVYLVSEIAKAFGAKTAYGFVKDDPNQESLFNNYAYGHIFIGIEHRVKIAVFIADVLLRKLKKARRGYMKTLSRVRITKNKIARADDFCLGWAVTVVSKLHEFTNTPDEQAAIDMYVANLGWDHNLKIIKRKSANWDLNDFAKGQKAATDVQIQHGVEGEETGVQLLEG
jgi:hypothetical protein